VGRIYFLKGASRRGSQKDPSYLIHWLVSEYFSHVSRLVLILFFYAATRNCTCPKRGENDVSDLALLDNADGSQEVGTIEVTVVVHLVLVMPYLSAAESVA
jgi:hypothetical protein